MKYLIILLLFISGTTLAEHRFLIPIATTHFGDDPYEFNNKNYGIGYEHNNKNVTTSVLYLDKNSYNEHSVYVGLSYEKQFNSEWSGSIGIAAATGYKKFNNDDLLILGVLSTTYKNLRLVTSYPSSIIGCPSDSDCSDFAMLMYVGQF